MDAFNLDYIIVDAATIIKEEFLLLLKMIKTYVPNLRTYIGGDDNQVDPVADRISCNYSSSQILKELADDNKIILEACSYKS